MEKGYNDFPDGIRSKICILMELLPNSHWKDTILRLLLIYYRWSHRWPVPYLSISTGDHRWNIRWPPQKLRMPPQWSTAGTPVDHRWPPVDCHWFPTRFNTKKYLCSVFSTNFNWKFWRVYFFKFVRVPIHSPVELTFRRSTALVW